MLTNDTNLLELGTDVLQCCSGDKIKKNEMGGACSADGGRERRVQGFGGKNLRERDQ